MISDVENAARYRKWPWKVPKVIGGRLLSNDTSSLPRVISEKRRVIGQTPPVFDASVRRRNLLTDVWHYQTRMTAQPGEEEG